MSCYVWFLTCIMVKDVAVSCGYSTCFAVRTCDGLYHFIFSIDRVGIPLDYTQKLTRSTLTLKLSVSPPYYPWVTATRMWFTSSYVLVTCSSKKMHICHLTHGAYISLLVFAIAMVTNRHKKNWSERKEIFWRRVSMSTDWVAMQDSICSKFLCQWKVQHTIWVTLQSLRNIIWHNVGFLTHLMISQLIAQLPCCI